ncbi:hypothetical protein IV454_10470 [Massilia antarctica]|uniref:Tox-GHH2 domain-containing protein n=1 Tax=Massilia antarctica TaxID=2765360 RepID=A0AA48WHN8_9BURK|nr:HNH/endonuclease VII fold toxin-2 domain-containing protein [Massilia antarctica]QPI51877.1 hypothetical protein IV454_10470 [Massilia antarctica]
MASTSNTPAMYFLDTPDAKKFCAKDIDDLKKQCAPDDRNKKNRGKGKPKARTRHGDNGKEGNWVMDHCGPLLMKPGEDFEDWIKDFKDVDGMMRKVAAELKDKVIGKIEEELLEYGAKAVGKMAVRRGLTGWIPVVGWIMTAVDVAVTAVDVATKVSDMKDTVKGLKDTVGRLTEQAGKITDTYKKYEDKIKNFPNLSKDEQEKVARDVMVDVQTAYATTNHCLRARKCMLVPYSKGGVEKWAGNGCCPGQTGHHLIPDAMFRDPKGSEDMRKNWKNNPANYKDGKLKTLQRSKLPKKDCWEKYSDGAAPTICAEGANQHSGSHGAIHDLTDVSLRTSGYAGKTDMPYEKARDLAISGVSKLYGCDPRCLKAQLDAYYCGKAASKTPPCSGCEKASVVPNSGKGTSRDGDIEVSNEE